MNKDIINILSRHLFAEDLLALKYSCRQFNKAVDVVKVRVRIKLPDWYEPLLEIAANLYFRLSQYEFGLKKTAAASEMTDKKFIINFREYVQSPHIFEIVITKFAPKTHMYENRTIRGREILFLLPDNLEVFRTSLPKDAEDMISFDIEEKDLPRLRYLDVYPLRKYYNGHSHNLRHLADIDGLYYSCKCRGPNESFCEQCLMAMINLRSYKLIYTRRISEEDMADMPYSIMDLVQLTIVIYPTNEYIGFRYLASQDIAVIYIEAAKLNNKFDLYDYEKTEDKNIIEDIKIAAYLFLDNRREGDRRKMRNAAIIVNGTIYLKKMRDFRELIHLPQF